MSPSETRTESGLEVSALDVHASAVGQELARAMRKLLGEIPGTPHKPTALARLLGIHRVIASQLISALASDDPYEVLQRVPGPESLRTVAAGAGALGVASDTVAGAGAAIERFGTLIRQEFGTRGALNAAISPQSAAMNQRFEQSSRYHVFKGMRQIVGVDAQTWITSMLFVPAPGEDDIISVTTIQGALGMRRLRPDAKAYFTFGPPYHAAGDTPDLSKSAVGLQDFYTHTPARLETQILGEQMVHRLADERLGKRAVADMLAVSHNARGSRRYASEGRRFGGVVVFTDIPCKTLVCDAILHDSVFPGVVPEFRVYKPGTRGPANPNDPTRAIDLIEFPERIEALGKNEDRFRLSEVPNYQGMITRVCGQIGAPAGAMRVFRVKIVYPVPGFQYVLAFEAPERKS
jgi:hypothetical protein